MSIFRGDASEVYRLADDLTEVGAKAIPAARAGMQAAGKAFEAAWRNDAARLHDTSSHFYPDSIDSELTFDLRGVSVDVGPNATKKQGFLGPILEFGGTYSPAYMTGANALARMEGPAERALSQALDPLF